MMKALQVIELFAGLGANGQPIVEKMHVRELENGHMQLVKSPAFIKGLASGDVIRCDVPNQEFEIVQRSGNLNVRVFSRNEIAPLADAITPQIEKLGGDLDVETPRMLVYSIHVSCGFSVIEDLVNQYVGKDSLSTWMYGNVYDPIDGQTPLNWWQEILKPE